MCCCNKTKGSVIALQSGIRLAVAQALLTRHADQYLGTGGNVPQLSFLNASPILLRRWLGISLNNLRRNARVAQATAADRLDVRRQTIGHYESGRNLPSVGDLEALLDLYQARDQVDFHRALRDGARRGDNWWHKIATNIPSWFNDYLALESGAETVDAFATTLVPGLQQTEEYATAVIHADADYTADERERMVQLRGSRRHILNGEPPVRLRSVVDESVLYRKQGDDTVMREQLRSLLDDLDHPQIELRVLPLDVGAFSGMLDYPFQLLTFPQEMVGDHGVAYIELLGDARYYEEAGEVERYQQAITDLLEKAADLEGSRTLIERAAKEIS